MIYNIIRVSRCKMKKSLLVLFICLFLFCGCAKEETKVVNEEAIKFKQDYESLNGKSNDNEVAYRNVTIDEDNPFVYSSGKDIVSRIDNKETFYVYFGDKQCPWCRSVIEKAIEVAKKNKIDKIYYVNIWDDDHNEILRDKYVINDDGSIELVYPGTESYAKLIDYFADVLKDYELTNTNGKTISMNEKRIFAPNFIYVENGKAIKTTEGISESQEDANEELSEELLKDEEKQFKNFFTTSNVCDGSC